MADINHEGIDSELAVEEVNPELKEPKQYKVILLNDDYTPMDFVIDILQTFFNMNQEEATHVMLSVHTKGKGVCGLFSKDIAETKVNVVNQYAAERGHPLLCTMEKDN